MGVEDLQNFLDGATVTSGSVAVDLLRIARSTGKQQHPPNVGRGHRQSKQQQNGRLSLVVDGECCLDRLYGGYFSDWACGGQWSRMVQFLLVFAQQVQSSNMELAIFFNGSLEPQRMGEWVQKQFKARHRINQVLKHIDVKLTPPPKVWWIPPVCLKTCLRMALRHLNITVLCTMDDHHQEVIAFCRENGFSGLMADDGEYAAFDPPRYFSSSQLKLTYKGSLETKEYIMSKVAESLGLTTDRLCVLAALLGNYLLTDVELVDFYRRIGVNTTLPVFNKGTEVLVLGVAKFVAALPSVSNLDIVAAKVFCSSSDRRTARLKQSIQYYMNGTRDGFLRYRAFGGKYAGGATHKVGHCQQHKSDPKATTLSSSTGESSGQFSDYTSVTSTSTEKSSKGSEESIPPPLKDGRFASETSDVELVSLHAYNEMISKSNVTPSIVVDPPRKKDGDESMTNEEESSSSGDRDKVVNGTSSSSRLLISTSSSSSSSSATSPSRLTPEEAAWTSQNGKGGPTPLFETQKLPPVPHEVIRTACERHEKGLMSPYIYQILIQGEIKLPMVMEDEYHNEIPSIHLVYRPVRQRVYAILFNLHHRKYLSVKKMPDKASVGTLELVKIREWVWSKENPYKTPEIVAATEIDWAVPTIQRLWFGSAIDDKRRRLRAFLTCMRSDTPLMLCPMFVPQHLLIMASVLRYLMTCETPIIRKSELDAFLVTALSPELMNTHYLQDLKLASVTSRGVQVAALFMEGVEASLLANDACGAPVPWLMCCPWLFFDGKLFHNTLQNIRTCKNLIELVKHNLDVTVQVERMRQAITEGYEPNYAQPPLPPMVGNPIDPNRIMPCGYHRHFGPIRPKGEAHPASSYRGGTSTNASYNSSNRPPAMRGRGMSRGAQLEIAGVVVGSWGPNYAMNDFRDGGRPQVTSVGSGNRHRLPPSEPYVTHFSRMAVSRNKPASANRSKKAPVMTNKKKGPASTKHVAGCLTEQTPPPAAGGRSAVTSATMDGTPSALGGRGSGFLLPRGKSAGPTNASPVNLLDAVIPSDSGCHSLSPPSIGKTMIYPPPGGRVIASTTLPGGEASVPITLPGGEASVPTTLPASLGRVGNPTSHATSAGRGLLPAFLAMCAGRGVISATVTAHEGETSVPSPRPVGLGRGVFPATVNAHEGETSVPSSRPVGLGRGVIPATIPAHEGEASVPSPRPVGLGRSHHLRAALGAHGIGASVPSSLPVGLERSVINTLSGSMSDKIQKISKRFSRELLMERELESTSGQFEDADTLPKNEPSSN